MAERPLTELLDEIHYKLVKAVHADLENGDRKARQEAMALLKQNNVTAVAAEGSTLSKLAGKLDFGSVQGKVVDFKPPISAAGPSPAA